MGRQLRDHARNIALFLTPLVGTWLAGCASTAYLRQATQGQLALVNRARPLEEVINSPKTSAARRALLEEVPRIKAFGEKNGLKETANYTEFVDLHRPWVTLLLTASPEFEFKAKKWSFPIVGEVSYLGFFDEKMARREAGKLKAEGYDVDLREVSAYSTLGWFTDPLLSSMLPSKQSEIGELVNVVLHETVHATLYIKNESLLNENIASFIGDRLTERYLDEYFGADSPVRRRYSEMERSSRTRRRRLLRLANDLRALYARPTLGPPEEAKAKKRVEKARLIEDARRELRLKRDINNATLVQFETYESGEKELSALYARCGKSTGRMLKTLKKLAERGPKPTLSLIETTDCLK